MIPEIFFVLAVIGAFHTFLALFGPRRPAWLSFGFFFGGWVAGDLGWFHIAWQAVATLVFVALGALDEPIGVAALLLTFASWAGLVFAAVLPSPSCPDALSPQHDTLPSESRPHAWLSPTPISATPASPFTGTGGFGAGGAGPFFAGGGGVFPRPS